MKTLVMLIAMLGAASPACATAFEIAGVELSEAVVDSATGGTLALNGAGVRWKFFFKIYVGALYLRTRSSSVDDILRMTGVKRVEMHFLYDEVSAEKLRSGWYDGFQENNPPAVLAALADRIDAYVAFFPTVREGDVVLITYRPGSGTEVAVNGERLGSIPGEDFNRALLRVWLGDNPPNASLKEGMLGLDR